MARDLTAMLLPRDVKKATEVVHARCLGGELTLLDRKLFNVLLAHAYRNIERRPTHRISIAHLAELFYDTGRTGRIRESLERLWSVKIEVDYEDEEGNEHNLRCHYLSFDFCHFEDGHIVYAFDPLLLRFLSNPKVYSQIQLKPVLKFSTVHALKLYEHMRMYYSRYHPVCEFSLTAAHDFFGAKGVYTKRFDSFRSKVIDPAVKEVNEHAEFGLTVDYQSSGHGGRVVGMTFKAFPKTTKQIMRAADGQAGGAGGTSRKRKDANTVDMFVGMSDREFAAARPVLRSDTVQQARRLMGPDADIDELLDVWTKEFASLAMAGPADEAFLSWLSLRAGQAEDAELAGLDLDAIYTNLLA